MARVLGLELGGAKNTRTTLAEFEVYPSDSRAFLLRFFESLGPSEQTSGDDHLLGLLSSSSRPLISVHAPLTLPPCLLCSTAACEKKQKCSNRSVKWMENLARKHGQSFPTGYTQRPCDLFLRTSVVPLFDRRAQFEIDDALGGSRAAVAARARFLQRRFPQARWIETLPKLTLAVLARRFEIPLRHLSAYRDLNRGVFARKELVAALSKALNIFVYEKDALRMAESLLCFDSFLSGITGVLLLSKDFTRPGRPFPKEEGWITFPKLKG